MNKIGMFLCAGLLIIGCGNNVTNENDYISFQDIEGKWSMVDYENLGNGFKAQINIDKPEYILDFKSNNVNVYYVLPGNPDTGKQYIGKDTTNFIKDSLIFGLLKVSIKIENDTLIMNMRNIKNIEEIAYYKKISDNEGIPNNWPNQIINIGKQFTFSRM